MKFKISPAEAKKQLSEENEFSFTVVMKHGSMSIEYFAPEKVDTQTPHKQDEIYVIIKGDGFFARDGERVACKKGDILFPTGMRISLPGLFSMDLIAEKTHNINFSAA